MASTSIKVELLGDSRSVERAFKKAGAAGESFGSKFAKAGKIAAVGFGGAVAGATVLLKKSFDAALEAEKSQTRLASAFQKTGATAMQRAAAQAQVNKVMRQSGLDDEDLQDSLSRLLQTTGNVTTATKDMAIAADVARGKGISLEQATSIVTKAQLGQVGGLKRLGIEIPQVTKAQDALKESHVKATQAQKDAAKAADDAATRATAIAALQRKFAGDSEAYGKTAAGAMDRFNVAVGNLQEDLGAKLLPVATRLINWSLANFPKFEAAVSGAFDRARVVAQQVIAYYDGTLRPTFESVVRTLTALWARFGSQLTAIFQNAWRGTKAVIDGALAVLRGDWSKAWESLKTLASVALKNLVLVLKLQLSIAAAAAKAIGTAILHAIVAEVGKLPGQVARLFAFFVTSLKGVAVSAGLMAVEIGGAIIDGVIHALAAGVGRLAAAARSYIVDTIKAIVPGWGSYPDEWAAYAIGTPIIAGIAGSLEAGSPRAAAAMRGVADKVITSAKKAVDDARGEYRSAWDGFTQQALAAFDDLTSKLRTAHERILDMLSGKSYALDVKQAKHDVATTSDELDQAKLAARATSVPGIDPEAMKAAQEKLFEAQMAYDRAELQLQQLQAQKLADQERKAQDEKDAVNRARLETWLATRTADQQRMLLKEGNVQKSIVKKIQSYDADYKKSGAMLGKALADGLESAAEAVEKAAKKLMDAANKYLNAAGAKGRTSSDAAKSGKPIPGFAAGGIVTKKTLAWIGERGPEAVVPLTGTNTTPMMLPGGGNTTVVNVSFPNYVGSHDDLERAMNQIVDRRARLNGNAFGGKA